MSTNGPGNPVELRPYQAEAVAAIVSGLAGGGRGTIRAACGTGKTRIAEEAARSLVPPDGLTVVVVPSAALAAQILAAWALSGWAMFAVCADDAVADTAVRASELPCPVSLNTGQIAAWVTQPASRRRLVVSTLASARVLGAALRTAGQPADLLVVDEAHRTAGAPGSPSSAVHDDTALPAARRLYMTATPRLGMSVTSVFGPVLYSYPFSHAIAEGWL